jgi:hypothetical protein
VAADVEGAEARMELDWRFELELAAAAASAELYNDNPLLKMDVKVRRPKMDENTKKFTIVKDFKGCASIYTRTVTNNGVNENLFLEWLMVPFLTRGA